MSNLASTSRVQLRYIAELVFGTTPVAGNPSNLRLTGESLNFDLTKEESKEIRSDRQVAGATTTDASSAGDINVHMQYAEYDPFLQALLMSSYSVYGTNGEGTSFTAAYTATTITASVAPTTTSAFTTLALGQWFRMNHTAVPGNHGKFFRVSTSVAPTSTVITLDANTPAAVAAATAGATIQTSRVTNDVVEKSFTIEKNFGDVGTFIAFRGMYVSKFAMNFAAAALSEGSFSFMGKDAVAGVVTTLPGTPVASRTFDIQNGVRGVGQLWEGGAPLSGTFIKSLDLAVDNNLRGQTAINNLGPVGIGVGDFKASGTFQAYFANLSLYNKFLADTYTAITVGTQDSAGNGYIFTMPRVQLMSGKIVAAGKNQDVMAEFQYSAFSDDANAVAGLRKTLIIDRVGAAVVP